MTHSFDIEIEKDIILKNSGGTRIGYSISDGREKVLCSAPLPPFLPKTSRAQELLQEHHGLCGLEVLRMIFKNLLPLAI